MVTITLMLPDGRSRSITAPAVPARDDFVSVEGAEFAVQDLSWSEDQPGELNPSVILIRTS